MKLVKIDDSWFEVPDEVEKRMKEYFDTMTLAVNKVEALEPAVKELRRVQKAYFHAPKNTTEKSSLLIRSKEAEVIVDNILLGKTKVEEIQQSELFR